MRRKLVRQGQQALTVTLPIKWLKEMGLEAGDEVDIEEEGRNLSIASAGGKKAARTYELNIKHPEAVQNKRGPFNIYRSMIGGIYRNGYDEIKIAYDNPKAIQVIQSALNSLYGFEMFDIDNKGCVVRAIYEAEKTDIKSYIQRMIHIIRSMQSILMKDIDTKRYGSNDEMWQFRNNILKQRDMIARSVTQKHDDYPYYLLAFNMWNIARSYNNIYEYIASNKKVLSNDRALLEKTNRFFTDFFTSFEAHNHTKLHLEYEKIKKEAMDSLDDKKTSGPIAALCLAIVMYIQSSNSSIMQLNTL